ncbi:MAG: protein translocase subunit SecD [Coxiellaceae bacterium]|nr:protein translocase subunit SecD [Coxiellaceae bacterium]
MNQYPLWKYLLLVVMILFGVLYSLPNLYGEDYAVQITQKDSQTISQQVIHDVEQLLNDHTVAYLSVVEKDGNVLVRFADTDKQLKASDLIKAKLGENYSVAPNLAPRTPKWLRAIGASPLKLGLDLRGGVHFLMGVDTEQVVKLREQGDQHTMGTVLRDKNIRYTTLRRLQTGGIVIRFKTQSDQEAAYAVLSKEFPEYQMTDTGKSGNFEIQAVLTEVAAKRLQDYAVEQSMNILRNRINELGVSEAVVQRQGVNKVSVDLPGVQDTARAKDVIGKTATLEFRMVDDKHDAVAAANSGVIPLGTKLYEYKGVPTLLKSQIILKGDAITYAIGEVGEQGPQVSIRLGGGGESLFRKVTANSVGQSMAVVYVEYKTDSKLVNGKIVNKRKRVEQIISIATIQSALGNSFRITGLASMQYANNLALFLRSGSFSAPINFLQERIVGPSLGKANINKGLMSLAVGSLLVILFMIMYYRLFGLIADLAILLNLVFIIALLSLLGATLTLSGIAGIVLTVGMAVDANVLINERIREELRNGMSPQAAIRAGYERAFSTIVDANVTTLIVAVVLFASPSGPVKSFAVTLTIGLMTSMVTAIFFTRACVNLIYGRRQIHSLSIGRAEKVTT